MPVSDVLRAVGSWDLNLKPSVPQSVVDLLDRNRYGRVVVDSGRDNPELLGDALLRSARYVGVLHKTGRDGGTVQLSGTGMAWWLGSDAVSDAIEQEVKFTGATFDAAIRGLLPASQCVREGTLHEVTGATYSGTHIYSSPRKAIDYVADLFSADWRVNGDATLDAGLPADLFVSTPQAAIIRHAEGWDMGVKALPGSVKLDRDVSDFTTRVVTVAEGNGRTVSVGTADIEPGLNPYKDSFGNPVKLTRLVSESNTSLINADARAQLQLNNYTAPSESITVTSTTHDIRGDIAVGDYVWVYDPEVGLIDYDNEIVFRGDRIWPVKLRVSALSWPVTDGMGVYFRTGTGEWVDLSDHVVFDGAGQSTITVGGLNKSLTNSTVEAPGSRVIPDSSVPAAPGLALPFKTSIYQNAQGESKARIIVAWTQPTNTNGTIILDGSHYEVQYRVVGDTAWQSSVISFDFLSMSILELSTATNYELRVRAVDVASPPNYGVWSDIVSVTTPGDTIPPATPAGATVAAATTSIQVRHDLGMASGGTYNLDPDLHHLEVHSSTTGPGYDPDASTLLGRLTATQGMIAAQTPAIGTFTVPSTAAIWIKVVAVDISGNRSPASVAVQSTALLIPSANIGDLDASKIVTGDFRGTYGLLGLFRTAVSGARFEAGDNNNGLNGMRLYRPSGTLALQGQASTGDLIAYQADGVKPTFRIAADTGNVYLYKADGTTPALTLTAATGLIDMIGSITAEDPTEPGDKIAMDPDYTQAGSGNFPTLIFQSSAGVTKHPARVNAVADLTLNSTILGLNSGATTNTETFQQTTLFLGPDLARLSMNNGGGGFADLAGGMVEVDPTIARLGFASGSTIGATAYANANGFVATAGATTGTQCTLNTDGSAVFGGANNGFVNVTVGGVTTVVSGGTVKSFVIDHPSGDPDRLLVHACLEGPSSAVFYRGTVEIVDHLAVVTLPDYFEDLTETDGRQVLLTPVITTIGGRPMVPSAAASEVRGGMFHILSAAPDGTKVHWQVLATRKDASFTVEPLRSEVTVSGDGPYRYIAA